MIKKFATLCLGGLLFFFTAAWGQQITVINTVTALDQPDKIFLAARFSPDGNKILCTEAGYNGLWLYDIQTQQVTQLNDLPGAGYAPSFSTDGTSIYFWTDSYKNYRRYTSLARQSLADGQLQYLIQEKRHLFPVTLLPDETIIYRQQNELYTIGRTAKANILAKPPAQTLGYVAEQKIVLFINGHKKELTPFGRQNYIWFSLAPDQTKMLFTVPGGGTFISDLEGQVLVKLGRANAPVWSPDGNWVVYMVDEDDGHTYTASDIFAASSDGKQKYQLTQTNEEIEMYPAWSPQMDKIVFSTFSGKIAYLNIEIK